jgi:hypothetical protein
VRRYIEPTLHHISRAIINSLATTKKLLGALSPSPSTMEAQAEEKVETTSLELAATAGLAGGHQGG